MSAVIFLDTETTGLAFDADIWEFAAIRREPDGSERTYNFQIEHNPMKCAELPDPFRSDHLKRYDYTTALGRAEAGSLLVGVFHDQPHVVGCNVQYDMALIRTLIRVHTKHRPDNPWHYHMIDVEAMMLDRCLALGYRVDLPWSNRKLAEWLGIPMVEGAHTALGDATYAKTVFDFLSKPTE